MDCFTVDGVRFTVTSTLTRNVTVKMDVGDYVNCSAIITTIYDKITERTEQYAMVETFVVLTRQHLSNECYRYANRLARQNAPINNTAYMVRDISNFPITATCLECGRVGLTDQIASAKFGYVICMHCGKRG